MKIEKCKLPAPSAHEDLQFSFFNFQLAIPRQHSARSTEHQLPHRLILFE
jgi:hypothetical protein